MALYRLLARRHADYSVDRLGELEDLYFGGYRILSRADRYLPPMLNEHQELHRQRCKGAAYLPYLGQIIDQLTAWLFSDALSLRPPPDASDPATPGKLPDPDFWPAFSSDADRAGTPFSDCVRDLVPCALLYSRAILGVDFPRVEGDEQKAITSRAAEKQLGKDRAYVYSVPVESLINWARDDRGRYKWAVVHSKDQPQPGPLAPSDEVVEEWKVWTIDDKPDARARWELYRIAYDPKKPPDPDKQDVPRVDEGETIFDEIPLCELQLPAGLCVGDKIGPLCKEHFQRRSTLIAAEYKSLVEIPVIKRGPEMSAVGEALTSETQQDPNRGADPNAQFWARGWVPIGSGDDLKFVGPSGTAYELVDKELAELKDEIFRVVHLMAASVSSKQGHAGMGRSGLSKKQDKLDTAIVLAALGAYARRFAIRVYDLIARARGEDVVWHAAGLDQFETQDREELLEEALQVDAIRIPSVTWKTAYKTRLAFKLDDSMPAETQDLIRDEIRAGVAAEHDAAEAMADAEKVAAPDGNADEKTVAKPAGEAAKPAPAAA